MLVTLGVRLLPMGCSVVVLPPGPVIFVVVVVVVVVVVTMFPVLLSVCVSFETFSVLLVSAWDCWGGAKPLC
jgi:hypothetical protein